MTKRVTIIADAVEHLGPDLAKRLARHDHDLVLGGAADGLVEELLALGAEVELVEEVSTGKCLTRPDAVQTLVERAMTRFGSFNSAFIRPAVHVTGDILSTTAEDFQEAFEGNMLASFFALQTLIKSLIEQDRGGQLLIGASGTGVKPFPGGTAYSSTKAGTVMMIRNAAITAAPHGITVNAIGTMALNYPGFLDNTGCRDPEVLAQMLKAFPAGRLGEPAEAAHIAAAMMDGESHFMSGEFISVSGGWTTT